MIDRPNDLAALIAEARGLVPDDRHIWCSASETFGSRLIQRRGLLLGGAISPHFLRDATEMWWEIPWAVRLRHCRVLVGDDKATHEPVAAWLPLMESLAKAGEALLVVAETVDSELLNTFVVNAFKGTLRVGVVHPAADRSGNPEPGARFSTPPAGPDQLPRIDEVWIRRTASVCFPSAGEPLAAASVLKNFAVIETGGENHEDQYERLRFLMRELQRPAR
jgi:hypothetical protein